MFYLQDTCPLFPYFIFYLPPLFPKQTQTPNRSRRVWVWVWRVHFFFFFFLSAVFCNLLASASVRGQTSDACCPS